jgi:hypothetical protein
MRDKGQSNNEVERWLPGLRRERMSRDYSVGIEFQFGIMKIFWR